MLESVRVRLEPETLTDEMVMDEPFAVIVNRLVAAVVDERDSLYVRVRDVPDDATAADEKVGAVESMVTDSALESLVAPLIEDLATIDLVPSDNVPVVQLYEPVDEFAVQVDPLATPSTNN